ncbi:unnamed protein product [Cladocopium goreaui]|uniref:Alpha-1,4-N-acetylglucosaminyltransferase n=1 Tax=Cladocopium goreaui TaxID=2562237 RepID=A0A9P1CD89_9DINO|nr:unnamed protein product [Cladocopium goreaui]
MDPTLGTRTLLCLSLASLLHLAWATCEASNLLQLPLGTLGALEGGRDSHGKADAISLSSPEFSVLLPKLDAKMEPLTVFRMKGDLDCPPCLQMVRALRNTRPTLKHPGVIHTGILLPEGADNFDGWVETARKLRLLPMSFLASQDLQNVKLYFWANVEQTHPLIQEIFAPLLGQYGKYIEIKRFDAAAEIKKVCSHYKANIQSFSNLTGELVKIYESQELVDSQSDLMRLFLLYNYGGAWIDSDTLLVQSLSPLLEEDWVGYMRNFLPNNNALSSSKPRSKFITAWLGHILQLGVNTTRYAYGPFSLDAMVREIQRSVANSTFRVLPGCFFEGVSNKGARAADEEIPKRTQFFNSTSLELMIRRRNYIDPRSRNHSTFGYHWHNQWGKKVEDSSMADAAEKLYCELLNIKLK